MRRLTLIFSLVAVAIIVVGVAHLAAEQRWSWSNDRQGSDYGNGGGSDSPGRFDYYALVLSWSPTYCSEQGEDRRNDQQCNRRDGRRYAFVLHGLWPQFERGYPQECRLQRRPFVPQSTIDSMLDIMPSPGLVIHEYKSHGTCSGLEPTPYFNLARRLFESIRVPDRFRNPFESQLVTPAEVERAFLKDNPTLDQSMVALVCQGGGRLREVRICFSKDGRPRSCGSNENQHRLCSSSQVFIPPVRSTASGDSGRGNYQPSARNQDSLPGPRTDRRY